ncbi:MAG: dienelactone hydrolase family protein [Aestuariivirgaceae bacterium]|nr:dienelactone hydrolase family protein [Aestuariivirgaceae bacterium]
MCDLDGCGTHADLPPIIVAPAKRRDFLKGLIALPLAAVLADPVLAQSAAARLQPITHRTPSGRAIEGVIAVPAKTPAPAVILIHEWWGLNDQIKAVANEFAEQGYVAIAVDLHTGKVAKTPDEAKALTGALDPAEARETLVAWIDLLKQDARTNGKVATVGWCFGGGWSLNASLAAPVDATVVYYGNVAKSADELKSLKGPLLGHFGTLDKNINEEMVEGFQKAAAEAGKQDQITVHWYDADHAFANSSGARYDAEDAKLAWERTMAFLRQNLG